MPYNFSFWTGLKKKMLVSQETKLKYIGHKQRIACVDFFVMYLIIILKICPNSTYQTFFKTIWFYEIKLLILLLTINFRACSWFYIVSVSATIFVLVVIHLKMLLLDCWELLWYNKITYLAKLKNIITWKWSHNKRSKRNGSRYLKNWSGVIKWRDHKPYRNKKRYQAHDILSAASSTV